ncbi:MAG: hypothetical protein Q9165_002833 [Trypethelium subeluteriae]
MSSAELIKAADSRRIFQGFKFWVAQRCPTRSEYVRVIQHLGGDVVPLETQADHRIVDHLRKDNPEGSLSYRWVEQSCKKGQLEPEKDYLQGPSRSASRATGSIQPGKSGRTPFSTEDDRVLRNWVEDWVRRGAKALGNEIYKALELENPRHPWQAWRNRYVKYVHKPSYTPPSNPTPPTPPLDDNITDESPRDSSNEKPAEFSIGQVDESWREALEDKYEDFTQDEFEELLEQAPGISMMKAQTYISEVWTNLAKAHPEHTARRWRSFYEDAVHPVHMEQKEQDTENQHVKSTAEASTYQEQGDKSQTTELNAVTSAVTQMDDGGPIDPERRGSSELRRPNARATPDYSSRLHEVEQTDVDASEGTPICTGQAHGSSVRKRLRSDGVEDISEQGEHASPTYKKKRLQSPQPSLKHSSPPNFLKSAVPMSSPAPSKPRVINLTSDEEDGNADDGCADEASVDEAEEIPVSDSNIAFDNAAESDESVEPSPSDVSRDSARQLSEGKIPRGRYSTIDEARQPSDEENESADSHSSFDPVTSSAIARAMTGKVPKSAGYSTQNTPYTPSSKRHSKQARSTSNGLRHGSENSPGWSPESITPTKLRDYVNEEAGPSRSLRPAARNSDSPVMGADKMPKLSVASHAVMDENGQIAEEHDDETADEEDLDELNDGRDSTPERRLSEEAETQAFFSAPTQQPDFNFLEPDGGFDALENSDSTDHSYCYDNEDQEVARDYDTAREAQLRQETVETQAFFEDDTLNEADLRMPSPETSSKKSAPSSSLPVISSSQEQERNQSEMTELREWIRDLVESGHIYDQVVRALQATCLDTGLALQILPRLESGKGIPEGMKGVWTAQDDEHLEGSDARLLKRLDKKHGDNLVMERMKFLLEWREGMNTSSDS